MQISADILLDRSKLKTKLLRWKSLAFCLCLILFITILSTKMDKVGQVPGGDFIARIFIEDIILEDFDRDQIIEKIASNNKIKAVIMHVNSPGGSSAGSEMLFNALKTVSEKKPLVAVLGTVAASGGYMAAIAADHIVAGKLSLTGSVGVIMQSYEISELAKKIGVNLHNFKSGHAKASPNPMESLTPEVQTIIDLTIQDSFEIFLDMVKTSRKLSKMQLIAISDGRVFTGNQAVKYKLIDGIGAEKEALSWLKEQKQISNLAVKEIKITKDQLDLQSLMKKIGSLVTTFSNMLTSNTMSQI